jgi:predicted component of type VI protein secretion system
MDDKKLRKLLEQLRDEIENAGKVDEKGRALLRDVDEHIRDLLARSDNAVLMPKPALARGLQDAVRHFEVTHPELTAALSRLLETLSNAGI